MKATAIAPSNIAFTKYWGKKDEVLRLPENGSISMCLSNLLTTTTVEFDKKYKKDEVTIFNSHPERAKRVEGSEETMRVIKHLDRIRKLAKSNVKAKVVSKNNFPASHGLSSSASGFAALTVAAAKASGLNLSEKQLSILARQGSGSACRSIPNGFVEWLDGNTSETSYAKTIFSPNYWKIANVVAIVSTEKKEVSTSEGQESASSSPFLKERLRGMKSKNLILKKLIRTKNFQKFGELIESEALELHSIFLTQTPPLIYLTPESLRLIKMIPRWRKEGLPVYFTVNTGQDVHLIVKQKNIKKLQNKLKNLKFVKEVIVNYPSEGTKLSPKHLF